MRGQKSHYAKQLEVVRKCVVIDAEDKILGRLASYVAGRLRGKYSPTYTPSVDSSDLIIIINADKIKVTGKKMTDKVYHWYTGYPGGLRSITLKDQMKKDSTKVLYDAIYGMLPHKRLGRQLIKHVRIYKNDQHQHDAQSPVIIEIPKKEM